MTWTVTHKGWFLLCPVYLADVDSDAIVPIPRSRWLNGWLELMFHIQAGINGVIYLCGHEEACGFLFYAVKPVIPFEIDL